MQRDVSSQSRAGYRLSGLVVSCFRIVCGGVHSFSLHFRGHGCRRCGKRSVAAVGTRMSTPTMRIVEFYPCFERQCRRPCFAQERSTFAMLAQKARAVVVHPSAVCITRYQIASCPYSITEHDRRSLSPKLDRTRLLGTKTVATSLVVVEDRY